MFSFLVGDLLDFVTAVGNTLGRKKSVVPVFTAAGAPALRTLVSAREAVAA
ncbi:hypothetical protein [Tsukamurella hominis]|uniref:hypothetical protein n=1 Tax=Tsukamurella hominis TaxID=1970232 RepID=UPI0039EA0B5D